MSNNTRTLGPLIGFFIRCLFFLLPAILMSRWIGWWALLPCAAFWITIIVTFRIFNKKRNNARNS